jgi:hypothetical protein
MEQNRVTVPLWNHPKCSRVAASFGDPEQHVRAVIAPLAPGSQVCLLVKRHGADEPFSYNYDWLHERPDLEFTFSGHLNAQMWAIAAEAKRAARGSQW